MLEHIRQALVRRHESETIQVVDAGINGNRIADIRERLDRDVLDLLPGAVVLYWDSDVSDVDETTLKPDKVRQLRVVYETDLRAVASRLRVGSLCRDERTDVDRRAAAPPEQEGRASSMRTGPSTAALRRV